MVLDQLMHIISTTEWKPKMFKSRHPIQKWPNFPAQKNLEMKNFKPNKSLPWSPSPKLWSIPAGVGDIHPD